MNSLRRHLLAATTALIILAPASLRATNGMNMEGYGPVATAMGGASIAFDHGTAAVIGNPATLSLMPDRARLDLALGMLGPRIEVSSPSSANNLFGVAPNRTASSTARAFYMPAFGYARRSGSLVYGFGIFGQGGMGCEYSPDSWRGLGFGLSNRTEVSVGRVIAPLAWKVNDRLHLGATVDFVWAGMDLKMAMSGAQFFDLVSPASQRFGRATGSIVQSFSGMMQTLPQGTGVDYAYFNFSNGSPFTGAARGYGYAGKLGFVYQATDTLTLGGVYQTQMRLSDLKTDRAAVSFQLAIPGLGRMAQSLAGSIRVHDFEWPAMLGTGLAFRPSSAWLLAADVRHVFWSDVMRQFRMSFTANSASANGPFAGQALDAVLFQNWENQTILQVGAAYTASDRLTLRCGFNHSPSPIPEAYVNCLFPATIETHLTAGFGWRIDARSGIDLSFSHGLRATVTNATGVTIRHRQENAQLAYSHRF